jgi:CRISPR-associated endonuclease Csn1
MAQGETGGYILGLDVGSASLGWALVRAGARGVLRAGVRIFDPGVDPKKFEKGQPGSSRNVERRSARLMRRQMRRRAGRQNDLFLVLQEAGLLPASRDAAARGPARHEVLDSLDKALRATWLPRLRQASSNLPAPEQVLPYALRAHALDHRLEPHELGRVLYQLGQRRGFKSNRREGRKVDEKKDERSKVKQSIADLDSAMKAAGARTLGEYFSRLDPSEARIRSRWTARKMYEDEFDRIWAEQAQHHPATLTPELKERLRHLLFFQRPIAANEHLIGMCELEPGQRRAPMATLPAQRFRLLQKVNDLLLETGPLRERALTEGERTALLTALEQQGDQTFASIRRLLKLPKTAKFNLERGGDKKLPGNRVNAEMLAAFGDRWQAMDERERNRIVESWRTTEDPEGIKQKATSEWALDEAAADRLAGKEPEDGYCSLSLKALGKLLPLMERGSAFKTAEEQEYRAHFSGGEAKELLPPVEDALPQIPNPAVKRSLTELRKVVNAIVREYGKPQEVRIELARDIKRNNKQRADLVERNKEQRARREKAKAKILREARLQQPSRDDIEKALLWEECGGVCPYTGKCIDFASLFGAHPQFDVEHIIPRRLFPDDSFGNKTLCEIRFNREIKRGRTPHEACSSDPELWAQILSRVQRMNNRAKLERFQLDTPKKLADFSARQMNDTRYVSKLAARYLGQLYGGRDAAQPEGGPRRAVFASSGVVTATLRKGWGLEAILREAMPSANGENKGKPRTDHRHHAVDALVVALTSNAAIKSLSDAAAADAGSGRVSSRTLQAPWPDFVASVRPHIEGINVSHRPSRGLNGPLHDETNYSPPRQHNGKTWVHVRKLVHTLTAKQITSETVIVDKAAREAVRQKLAEVGGEPKKLEQNPPRILTRTGKTVPVCKVRIRVPGGGAKRIAEGHRERHVMLNANHHIAIFSGPGRKGQEKWEGIVVTRLEAMDSKRRGEPIIQRTLPEQASFQFQFSLMGGDMVEMQDPKTGARGLFVVRGISESAKGAIEVDFARSTDARIVDEMKKTGDWLRVTRLEHLRQWGCRKVVVDALGRVHSARD